MANETPFEANYEKAKQSIIAYIGQATQTYDIPSALINALVYEIALESRVNTLSMILAGCDVSYKKPNEPEYIPSKPKNEEDKPVVEPYTDEDGNTHFPPKVTWTPAEETDAANVG